MRHRAMSLWMPSLINGCFFIVLASIVFITFSYHDKLRRNSWIDGAILCSQIAILACKRSLLCTSIKWTSSGDTACTMNS